ncbi:unnamed protein product [Hyaloperonospora brassicae]|uniref:DnaJ homologue subfamily C GRV2/DNAJC13 N-terminal domain-containing protein n=1 Tax=Hyaloperonospora brassicae TaxID=162125 RepID=A0AAV0U4L8_HYABA|nr:unnamed protein product [Hyaloperonospora brassicae]
MGQAGSVQQQHALRNVLSLRTAPRNVSDTELEEILCTFCALFPLELQVPDASFTNVVRVAVKQRRLFDVMHELLQEQTVQMPCNSRRDMTPLILTSFRRVIRWRELYKLCAKCSLKPFLACLHRPARTSVLSGLETLELMLSPCLDFDVGDKAADRSEAANRRHFAESGGYEVLVSLLVQYGTAVEKQEKTNKTEPVLQSVLNIFIVTLVSRRARTDAVTCTQAVNALTDARVTLLDLCHCREGCGQEVTTLAIRLVKGLFRIADLDQVHRLQETARVYGALLYALETAVQEDAKMKTTEHREEDAHSDELGSDLQKLCADLVAVFCAGNSSSTETMNRILPVGLFMPAKNRVESKVQHTMASPLVAKATLGASGVRALPHFSFDFDHPKRLLTTKSNVSEADESVGTKRNRLASHACDAEDSGGGACERWRSEAREKGEHWRKMMKAILLTHESPKLVWRAPMRAELHSALQGEIEALERRRRHMTENEVVRSGERIPRWHYEMFHVSYASMHKELVVNNYFVKYLIPHVADLTNAYEIAEPVILAWHLFDQLAVEDDEERAIWCARCLRLIVRRYAMLFHGQIPTHYVLLLLRDHMNHSPAFVRECFLLLHAAIGTSQNVLSEHLSQLGTTVARTVVDVLTDPALLATLSTPLESVDTVDQDASVRFVEPEDEAVAVVNQRDGMLRAGISVLLAVTRRDKFALQLLRPKRIIFCRLIAVETLDHVTITHVLFLLEQLELLDNNDDDCSTSSEAVATSGCSSLTSYSPVSAESRMSATVDSSWRSLTLVYALLASCDPKGMGMCVATAAFLKKCCAQPLSVCSKVTDAYSITSFSDFSTLLRDALGFGGCGMERLLLSVSSEKFTNVFNVSQIRAADVNWGLAQRVRLYRYLKLKYMGFSEQESTPSWKSVADADADHHYEDDDIFIGNIFLRSYVEGDGEFLGKWMPEVYSESIYALFEELAVVGRKEAAYVGTESASLSTSRSQHLLSERSCAAEPWEVQVLILKALARLVPARCCAEVKIKSDFYESLLAPLRRSMLSEADQLRGILSLELFVSILSTPEKYSLNTGTCRLFFEERGLQVLADCLERMRGPTYQHALQMVKVSGPHWRSDRGNKNMARVLLRRLTEVLSTLANQEEAGVRAIRRNPEVVIALIELASRQVIVQYANIDAASLCLRCLGGLCRFIGLRALVVNAGGILSLLDIVAFCPAGDIDEALTPESLASDTRSESDTSCADDGEEGHATDMHTHDRKKIGHQRNKIGSSAGETQRTTSRFFGAIRSAALVLRACLEPKGASAPGLATQLLHQLLTPSFVRVLRSSPDRFVLAMQTAEDIDTATLIWTVSMRQRLQKCITTELAKVQAAAATKTWPRWNPEHLIAADSFRYQYPELSSVLVLHDVYLAKFVATPMNDLDLRDIDIASFSEALLISIQSHENVLRILQERRSSDHTKEAAVRLMRQTLDKLVRRHPQHNLEVNDARPGALLPPHLLAESSNMASPSSNESLGMQTSAAAGTSPFSSMNGQDWDSLRFQRCSLSEIDDLTV